MSLAAAPTLKASGAFGDNSVQTAWTQPSGRFQAQHHNTGGLLIVNGHEARFESNDLLVVPPGSRCEIVRDEPCEYMYNYFSFMPVEENEEIMAIPLVSKLGHDGFFWDLLFRRALNQLITTNTFIRAVMHSMLWSVAVPPTVSPRNPYVAAAEKIFRERLSESLSISDIAHELHISASQLNRLFLAELGRTPLQFLLELRAARAHDLLTGTTLPIKAVASACGISNAHAFNRFVRSRLGASPRSIRMGTAAMDVFRVATLGYRKEEFESKFRKE